MGFQTWGLVSLKAVLESGHVVPLVVTHPDPVSDYDKHFNDSIRDYASDRGIPVLVSPNATSPSLARRISEATPDLLISSNWRAYLPPEIFNAPSLGALNIHRSLLPKYAGLAPINWAVSNGESMFGVTIHQIAGDFDLGDIAMQESFSIGPSETATEVFHKTNVLISRMLPALLRQLETAGMPRIPQDPTQASFYHRRGDRELRIDWTKPRGAVFNLIRAQSDPFANAYTYLEGRKVRIKTARLAERPYFGTPGRVVDRDGSVRGVVVLCGTAPGESQGLVLRQIQIEDGPPIDASDVLKVLGLYFE